MRIRCMVAQSSPTPCQEHNLPQHTPAPQRPLTPVQPLPPLQLYVDKSIFEAGQPEGFAFLKNMVDAGDIVGVTGGIKRTEKGELSVMVKSLQVGHVGAAAGLWGAAQLHVCRLVAARSLHAGAQVAAAGVLDAARHWHFACSSESRGPISPSAWCILRAQRGACAPLLCCTCAH